MYGRIHYEAETGEKSMVECQTEADYQRELKAGCRWVEDEPRQLRNIWGEVVSLVKFHINNPRPMPSPLWDLARPSR